MSRLSTWEAISNFVSDLNDSFVNKETRGKYRPLGRYAKLVSRTVLSNKDAIDSHITTFAEFCKANRESIKTKKIDDIVMHVIKLSDNCYIELTEILKEANSPADSDFRNSVWSHLRTISAHVDPGGKIREVLQAEGESRESDFLHDIISKVEKSTTGDEANPMAAVVNMMQSGVFNDLLQGLSGGQDGKPLDFGKLMSSVQKLVTANSGAGGEEGEEGGEDDGDSKGGEMNAMTTMLSSLGAQGESSGGDMSNILGMLGPMLGNLMNNGSTEGNMPNMLGMLGKMTGQQGPTLQESIEEEVKQAKKSGKLATHGTKQIEILKK